jgi:FkbH-like protein
MSAHIGATPGAGAGERAVQPSRPEAVRLVIWDLDDTYWTGTLAEEGMTYLPASEEIVMTLARRGIMNSICSKNEFDRVRGILQDRGVWDYFIFPSINWDPKGPRIREIVESVQLRPASIMFVDDNPANLQEAAFHVPGIQLADPAFLATLLADPRFAGKADDGLSRLKQYKVLEEKHRSRASYSDNREFLRASNIQVSFEYDVATQLDRAIELINRTNQLNFTKRRLAEDQATARDELRTLLRRQNVHAALIAVTDAYGDYGYAGIYVMDRTGAGAGRLLHFTFSCRILNMHVESWVYRELGRPLLDVKGEVLSDPVGDDTEIDWINSGQAASDGAATADSGRWPAVYLRGGCDLAAVTHYSMRATDQLVSETNFIRDGLPVRLDHSLLLWYALKPPAPAQRTVLQQLGYEPDDLVSRFFDESGPPGALRLISFWADMDVPLYRHKATRTLVPFWLVGHMSHDLTAKTREEMGSSIERPRPRAAWEFLVSECEYVGFLDRASHLEILREIIQAVPSHDFLVVIAANEGVPGRPRNERHVELNERIELLAREFPHLRVIRPGDFITGSSDVHDLNHFDRMVYFRMYGAIRDCASPMAEAS